MRLEQLQTALDRYGGNLERWPAEVRSEADALVARDVQAAAALATAQRLDTMLAEAVAPTALDAAFVGRIVAGRAETQHHDVAIRATPRFAAWAGAAMVAFLVTGYAVGAALPISQGEDAFAGLMFGNASASDTASDDGGSVL
jgi:hypothetical protein